MLGPEKSIGWGTVAFLVLLTVGSYALDFLSGYFGARYFGATKWGMFGALLGALIGIFFGLAGLFVGPVIGAVAGEFIAGKRMIDAGRAGWGSLLGNLGAMMGKLFIALVMITVFFLTVPSPLCNAFAYCRMRAFWGSAASRSFLLRPVVIDYWPMADDRWRVPRWRDLLEESPNTIRRHAA